MKRFSFFATAALAVTLGVAACSDTPTQPTAPALSLQEAEMSALEAKYGGRSPKSAFAACMALTNNLPLCTNPLATVCTALRTGGTFTFTITLPGQPAVTYTLTITPTAGGAMIGLSRNGVGVGTPRLITTAAIARLCNGGGIDNGGDDDDKDDDRD